MPRVDRSPGAGREGAVAAVRPVVAAAALLLLALVPGPRAAAGILPAGFQESVVLSGLTFPTVVQFAADGRVFVAEKSGLIKVFAGLFASTPTIFADLRSNVHSFGDRGLLGMALDPDFPSRPYVYVLYTHDPRIGDGDPSGPCPASPGATAAGCVVSARLSRLEAAGNVVTGSERVLIQDWCQQYPSHSIGSLAFGADGALYVSAGDGASFTFVDYGQRGRPLNPCGDPPVPVGGAQTLPTAEGGALRSQDLRTSGDPVTLDGAILRVDPDTGMGLPDNPLSSHADANARRIIAYGLRNPFRIAVRPGTREVWVGDVGWDDWEEINRVVNPTGAVANFGWPCYEGPERQAGYDGTGLNICENLYREATGVTAPFYAYGHTEQVVAGELCPTESSAITGLAFYDRGSYPAEYRSALFFADYARECIWVMFTRAGTLAPETRMTFLSGAASPVDLKIGPSGDLFYVDINGGTIRRIQHLGTNRPPTAVVRANRLTGEAPLTVTFDGTGSKDPDPGDAIASYVWDLDGDGQFDDATAARPTFTYSVPGPYSVRLRVTDTRGASATSLPVVIAVGTPPAATMAAPLATATWQVGDVISFSGSGSDAEDGPLPASSLTWKLTLHHCAPTCHAHPLAEFTAVASGTFVAPDHEHPSHLELELTATDSTGLATTTSVLLHPRGVTLAFESTPPGLQLVFNSGAVTTPFDRTVIVGSNNSLSAPSPQTLAGQGYEFASWSDAGARSHDITAGGDPVTYRAVYRAGAPGRVVTGPGPGRAPEVRLFGALGAGLATAAMAYDAAFTGGVFVAAGNVDGVGEREVVTGADAGGGPHVRVFRTDGSDFGVSFFAYQPAFTGGVRVASCDVNGDGTDEIITAAGPGGGPHVRVWQVTGATVRELAGFMAYTPAFTGGVYVGCGDVDADGRAEIVTGPDAGGGPHVRVWKIASGLPTELFGFFAYSAAFAGGVRVAAGDVDGDGRAELLTAAGPGGGPHVRVWQVEAAGVTERLGFYAYDPAFTGGVFVAAGDVDGRSGAEIITGAGAGGGPHVRVFSSAPTEVTTFFAFEPQFGGGVRVGSSR